MSTAFFDEYTNNSLLLNCRFLGLPSGVDKSVTGGNKPRWGCKYCYIVIYYYDKIRVSFVQTLRLAWIEGQRRAQLNPGQGVKMLIRWASA